MSKYKMMIVDDEWIISDSLISMKEWAERDIEVVGAPLNGREAIELLEEEHIDFIITDIRMPEIDGIQLLQYVFINKPYIKVIMISGYEDFSYAHNALKYKANAYVLKPIDTKELVAAVDDIILQMPPVESFPESYRDSVVNDAKIFIQNNLDKRISLADVAETVHLSPHYFGKLFREATGEKFIDYLTTIRMEKACELLKNPCIKHYEISTQLGYTDPNYFTKVFQRYYAKSPSEYRQQMKHIK